MWFIDWLEVHQDHFQPLPIVGSQMVSRIDIATGEPVSESPSPKKVEASHSTTLSIRCNGTRVSVSGNPSRFNRPDNLFGFTRLSDCIAVYNQILIEHGLPPFTAVTDYWYRQSEEGSKAQLFSDGAMIDRIDITRNFSVSSGKEFSFIRGLSTQSICKGKQPNLYPNGATVDWYKGSTSLYKKVYKKSQELTENKKKNLKNSTYEDIKNYEKLIEWCDSNGILREEHEFKSQWLRRNKLCFYGMTKENDFINYLGDIETAMKRLQIMKFDYETIAEQLIKKNIVNSHQSANATQAVAHKWLHGSIISKNTQYYVHRRRLLPLGIDISIPHDVSKMPPQIRSNEIIEVKYVQPPSWYRMPQVRHLKLAS